MLKLAEKKGEQKNKKKKERSPGKQKWGTRISVRCNADLTPFPPPSLPPEGVIEPGGGSGLAYLFPSVYSLLALYGKVSIDRNNLPSAAA